MKKEQLISLFKEILNEDLLEITPSSASEAGNLFRRLGNTFKSGSKAEMVAKDIVNTMNLGGAKGEAINIFGKLTKDSKGKIKFTKSNVPSSVTNSEELLIALKNGAIDAENLARVNKGVLKSPNATTSMIDDIVGDVIIQPKFIEKYGKVFSSGTKGEQQVRTLLKDNGYSQVAIESMVKRMKSTPNYGKNVANIEKNLKRAQDKSKALDAKVKDLENQIKNQANTTNVVTRTEAVQNIEKTTKQIESDVKPIVEANKSRLRDMTERAFKKFKNAKKLLAAKWLIGLGLVGGGAYYIGKSLFGGTTKPDGTNTIHPKCITDLLDDDGSSVAATSSGDPVVKVTKTGNSEYDDAGGLLFYTNNRVFTVDRKKRGTWSCSGSSLEVKEDLDLNEQGGGVSQSDMIDFVDTAIDDLDGFVGVSNLQSLTDIVKKLRGKTYKGKNALSVFMDYYKREEGGDDFIKDVESVGIRTLGVEGIELKDELLALLGSASSSTGGDGNKSTGIGNIKIVWDGQKKSDDGDKPKVDDGDKPKVDDGGRRKKQKFHKCDNFPFEFGCKSPLIGEIQKCIGVSPTHGNFGPITLKALQDLKHDVSKGITKEIYDKILEKCGDEETLQNIERPKLEPIITPQRTLSLSGLADKIKTPELKVPVIKSEPDSFYRALVKAGFIDNVPDEGDGKRRVKYKGPDLDDEQLSNLDTAMSGMGYDRIKQLEKDYGSKYVYLKRD